MSTIFNQFLTKTHFPGLLKCRLKHCLIVSLRSPSWAAGLYDRLPSQLLLAPLDTLASQRLDVHINPAKSKQRRFAPSRGNAAVQERSWTTINESAATFGCDDTVSMENINVAVAFSMCVWERSRENKPTFSYSDGYIGQTVQRRSFARLLLNESSRSESKLLQAT